MDPPSARSRAHQFASSVMAVASIFITSLWVAICAVAPEFIWRGLRTAYEHPDWSDLLSALLIGLILAFFVEPATQRVRADMPMFRPAKHPFPPLSMRPRPGQGNPRRCAGRSRREMGKCRPQQS